jgi:hypothetical protein
MNNSTLSRNEAEEKGGGIDNWGNLYIFNTTLSENVAADAGGIHNRDELKFINTIIAGSTGGDCVDIGTINTVSTHNLVQDGSCQVDDLSNINSDPKLGPLADNGGPTWTHALLPGSPAIDAGVGGGPTIDQRGVPRPQGAACDIGAFEVEYRVVTNNANDGDGSLRQAITDISPGGIITFNTDLSGETITLSSQLVIDKNLTIDGSSLAVPIAISGNDNVRVFLIGPLGEITLDSLKIINGNMLSGGGIYNQGELTIINSTLSGNNATEDGGGIYNHAELTIINSTLSGNNVQSCGGGILNTPFGTLIVTNNTLSGNNATESGGGIYNMGSLNMSKCTLSDNTSVFGGGIYNHEVSPYLAMDNSTLSGNEAEEKGGGIDNWGNLYIFNTTLSGNVAADAGGIHNRDDLQFVNTIIAGSTGGDCVNNHIIDTISTHNLVQDGSCQVDDLSNINGDPKLGPLEDNGGPTWTHALLPGSPAIDSGVGGGPTIDQRGVTRPKDGNDDGVSVCDIGAFEFDPAIDGVNLIYLPLILLQVP